jgi:hypothetical protein
MSGGGGSGGGGQSYQQTKSSNEPPAFIQPYLKQGIGDLSALYSSHPNAPDYYPNSTVAPQSDYTKQAVDALGNFGGAGGAPYIEAAGTNLTDTLNGKYLDPTSNPQFQTALTASHQPYIDQFNSQVLPGITSAFEGSGRTGSGLHQASVDRAVTGLNRTISDSDAKAGADYFTQARGQQLQAAGLIPQVTQANLAKINATGEAGDITDAYNQSKINEDVSRYNYNNNKQWDYISRYLGIVNGGYPGGESTGSSYGYQPYQGGGFGSFFGPAMSMAGLGLQAATLFSDARLKEDISAPIGETYDGTPIRLWRYKGDPTPHVGFIAQEVAAKKPDAVELDPSGYLKVNYAKAGGLF